MFRQLNLRSFFVFLGRNKLYTAINIFGLSLSLMFVVLIANYTTRQLTVDNYHSKADRIRIISSEKYPGSGYYLQKYLLDRYPEIESTCAVGVSGWSSNEFEDLQIGTQKLSATAIYADSTFLKMFDFPLAAGDREQALASKDNVILSESFAARAFGTFNPLGQVIRIGEDSLGNPRPFVVSAVIRDVENSAIPNRDLILRAERLTELNGSNDEHMSNSGAVVTYLLVREGADLEAKIPDMLAYFKEMYWPYKGNVSQQVLLTPLKDYYFSPLAPDGFLNSGSWSFVLILIAVGLVILFFAVINYINLTVAQTGFRAKEMATRRLLGSSRGEVMVKLILESMLMCAAAFGVALLLAVAVEPYASQLLEYPIDVLGDMQAITIGAYVGLVVLLGVLAGLAPAIVISRFKPLDVMNGTFRRRTKTVYSNALIALQNLITVVLLAASLTITLQIRHLISAPLGYHTADILNVPTDSFKDYGEIQQFRDALRREPFVEAVGMGCGTPIDRGNNNTMTYGPDRMVSFQIFICDSVYFRMLGFQKLRDNHVEKGYLLNQYAFNELGVDQDAPVFKLGPNHEYEQTIAGTVADFQVGSALDKATSVMMRDVGDFDRFFKDGKYNGDWPWNILIQVRGDHAVAYSRIRTIYEGIVSVNNFQGQYFDEQIATEYAAQQRLLRIVGVFTLIAVLISALGLLAMSTYYIQQKQQEVAVRKVFGSTRAEVLSRLVGHFMRLVAVAFVIALPVSWYVLSRWLEDYSVRIALSPLIFLAAGAFAFAVALVVVFWQSRRAANANPVESIKN